MRQGQAQGKGAALARPALSLNAALMVLHNALYNRKSQSAPASISIAGLIGSIEAFKDMRQILWKDAYPTIAYPYDCCVLLDM